MLSQLLSDLLQLFSTKSDDWRLLIYTILKISWLVLMSYKTLISTIFCFLLFYNGYFKSITEIYETKGEEE